MNGQNEVSVSINIVVGHGSQLVAKQVEAKVRYHDGQSLEREIEALGESIAMLVGSTVRQEAIVQVR